MKTCQQCGQSLDAAVGHDLCPECMLKVGLGTGAETKTSTKPPSTPPPLPPRTAPDLAEIAKHFPQLEILELLPVGGMGTVYKARQKQLDRVIALKILPPELGRDPEFAERFLREARALAKLNHPNIVTVHEFGETDGLFYLIMEYVDGVNLRQMEQSAKLTPAEALVIIPKICDALQYAHDEGVVHRDIKPANILIDKKGRVKLADFGLAKLLGKSQVDFTLTGTNQAMGTPQYMAPEQVEKPLTVDHRADIYSLGVVFYEMLTGELPMGRFALPSRTLHVDVRLDEVVLKTLEKEPDRRYQHVSQVKTDVENVTSQPAVAAQVKSKYQPAVMIAVGFAVVLLAALIGALVWSLGKPRGNVVTTAKPSQNENTASGGVRTEPPVAVTDLTPFTWMTNNGAITITKYIGPGGAITLPSTINGLPVTSIGSGTFEGCTNTTSVTIPASITSLGAGSLSSRVLLSIVVDGANPAYCSTSDGVVFTKDKTCLISYPSGKAGDYVIPQGVTRIGEFAFDGCHSLTRVTIPNSVTNIGGEAFRNCTRLTPMAISASVKSIGRNPFTGCDRLASLTVDAANPAYASSAAGVLFDKQKTCLISYSACKDGSYVIPDSVTSIGACAFVRCTNLTNVTIPNSVTSIGDCAFYDCSRLANVTIPSRVTSIGQCVFVGCRGLTNVTIPNSVVSIGYAAFFGCAGLTNVTIPNSVTSIGVQAFWGCSGLTTVTIPASVTTIEGEAFNSCTNLTSAYFEGNAPSSDSSVFAGAKNAAVYYLPGTKGWGKEFGGRPTALWELPATDPDQFACMATNGAVTIIKYTGEGGAVTIPGTISGLPVTSIKNEAFQNCTNLTSIAIPNSVTSLGAAAFKNCASLAKVTLGTGVASLQNEVFLNCSNLTSVAIPNSVTNIGISAFKNCASLAKVTIGSSVASIGDEVFSGCTKLNHIALPASVTSINFGWWLSTCTSLTAIMVDALNPTYSSSADGVMFDKERTTLIRYPPGKVGTYAIPNRVTRIGDSSFHGCTNLTGITIPDGVVSIGGHAFTECTGLSLINIPASVTSIAGNCAVRCSQLKRFVVDDANKSYRTDSDGVIFSKDGATLVSYPRGRRGDYAIPSSVTYIGFTAFEGCPELTKVTIPDSVNNIEGWSFVGNHNLISVTIPSGITEIKHCTFYDCRNLASVYFKGNAPRLNPEWWWSFGGSPIIYHRPGATGWGKELAGKPTAVWIPEAEGRATNLTSKAFTVSEAEKKQDWDAALLEYENAYDSKGADEFLRSALRKKFAELLPKVQPNRDPAKAGVWKVKAYAFRELDYRWTDKEGKNRRAQWKMREDEIGSIRTALGAFTDRVWEYTSGSLRIDWTLEVIDTPLAKLDGDGSFWPGPGACLPYLAKLQPGEADTIMVYAKVQGGKDEPGDAVPMAFLGGSLGVQNETKGAAYIGFNTGGDLIAYESPGEAELHEWLHNVKWTLEEQQLYPAGLLFTADGGRVEGELGGDYCYRKPKDEKGWLGYYRHLMQTHVTRRMWRELSLRNVPNTVWINQYVHHVAWLGTFPAEGKPDWGINEAFIDEESVVPKIGEKVGNLEWKVLDTTDRRILTIGNWQPNVGKVCYLAIGVQSDKEQKAQVMIGSDNHAKLWHNGNFVLTGMVPGAMVIDQFVKEIVLKPGMNRFLLKVADGGGWWAASFRLCGADGGLLAGVRYIVE